MGQNWAKVHKGKSIYLNVIDGEEFCFINLVKDIENGCGFKGAKIEWIPDGSIALIENGSQQLNMWDLIKSINGVFNLYYTKSSYPTLTPKRKVSRNSPTTHTKFLSTPRKPRRLTRLINKSLKNVSTNNKPDNPIVLEDSDSD